MSAFVGKYAGNLILPLSCSDKKVTHSSFSTYDSHPRTLTTRVQEQLFIELLASLSKTFHFKILIAYKCCIINTLVNGKWQYHKGFISCLEAPSSLCNHNNLDFGFQMGYVS